VHKGLACFSGTIADSSAGLHLRMNDGPFTSDQTPALLCSAYIVRIEGRSPVGARQAALKQAWVIKWGHAGRGFPRPLQGTRPTLLPNPSRRYNRLSAIRNPRSSPLSTHGGLNCAALSKYYCQRRSVRYIRAMLSAALSRAPETKRHRVLVVGGLARLQQEYRCCGNEQVTVDVANANSSRLGTSVSHSDSVVVVVTRVSHAAVQVVHRHARSRNLPIAHATSSSARHISETILRLTQREGNE